MSNAENMVGLADRIGRLFHTVIRRWRFAAWGNKSRIEHSAKLIAPHLVAVGAHVHICEHAWLNARDDRGDGTPTLHIGDGSYIGRFIHINAWQNVTIEKNVLIADRVFISDCEHAYSDPQLPIAHQGDVYRGPVTLREGCWIGINAVILPGVTVGRNAVVAANSVVRSDVADQTVVAGAPARFIKTTMRNVSRNDSGNNRND